MKKLKILLPVAFLVLGGLAVKALGNRAKPPRKAPAKERSIPVETSKVKRVDAPFWVQAEGTVAAVRSTALSAQVSGRVVSLHRELKTGGRFRAGDVMLRLDARDYEARAVQAQAAVKRAQMEFDMAQQRQSVAQAEYATSGLGKADEAHPLAQHEPQVLAAQAALESARAGLRLANLALERTKIKAPYACLVRRRMVEVGDVVGPGRQLAMVAGTQMYEVIVAMSQERLALLRVGGGLTSRQVKVHSQVGTISHEWTGRVDRVEGEVEPLGRLARLAVRIDAPTSGDNALLLGSFVRVQIAGSPLKKVIVVPERAMNQGVVFVVDGEGRLEKREVVVAHRVPGSVYVAEGLNAGDELVVSRLNNPVVGSKVRRPGDPVPAPPADANKKGGRP